MAPPTISPTSLRLLRHLAFPKHTHHVRPITTSASLLSGHSKWATIKHDKAKADSRKNKARNIFARDIVNSTRLYGADIKFNAKLATAIANAKSTGMSKQSIEAAVLRGQGKTASGAALETLTVEAMVGREKPVAMIVEVECESKAMALQEIRVILKKEGAVQTPTQFLFERRGRVTLETKEGLDVDRVMEGVLDAEGVVDVGEDEEERVIIDTLPDAIKAVEAVATQKVGVSAERVETIWHSNEETRATKLEGEPAEVLERLTESLEDFPGVQKVWTNLATA